MEVSRCLRAETFLLNKSGILHILGRSVSVSNNSLIWICKAFFVSYWISKRGVPGTGSIPHPQPYVPPGSLWGPAKLSLTLRGCEFSTYTNERIKFNFLNSRQEMGRQNSFERAGSKPSVPELGWFQNRADCFMVSRDWWRMHLKLARTHLKLASFEQRNSLLFSFSAMSVFSVLDLRP